MAAIDKVEKAMKDKLIWGVDRVDLTADEVMELIEDPVDAQWVKMVPKGEFLGTIYGVRVYISEQDKGHKALVEMMKEVGLR